MMVMQFPAWKVVQRRPRGAREDVHEALIALSHAHATGKMSHDEYVHRRGVLYEALLRRDWTMGLVG